MAGEVISPISPGSTAAPDAPPVGGGAGRGGSSSAAQGPLVVVQQPRSVSPPRPAPRQPKASTDVSLRNGYAAISHSVSGETAAIGLGFLVGGPVGAVVGGTVLPAVVAASMWRARRREHDENTNRNQGNGTGSGGSGSGRDRSGSGGRGSSGGRARTPNGADGGARKPAKGPKSGGSDGLGGKDRKPKIKDPVADKLGKAGKGLVDKLRPAKGGKHDKPWTDPKGSTGGSGGSKDTKTLTDPKPKKPRKDHSSDYPDDRRWRGRGHKDPKPKKQKSNKGGDVSSSTAPDGLDPKDPKGGEGKDPVEDRIDLVRAKREKAARRAAIRVGKKAAADAARDGSLGDPHAVQVERIRAENQWIDLELHRERHLLALTAAAETPRSTPVNYPATTAAPAGTRTAGTAVARQVDPRSSTAYAILKAMADQLANGLHNDDDADMGDHLVELVGIGGMCRSLSVAVTEAGHALAKTAPLHPSVIKHLNNAATAARTAGVIADSILIVFVREHREDIMRVLAPRVGEERWNIRDAAGTLDAAKLRAAISSAHVKRAALPAGASGGQASTAGRLVPASEGSTKKLINLMKGFTRGHMVDVLSEVAGSAAGVEAVAESVTGLYRRMAKSWPTETAVDDTVRATASKVQSVAAELRKAIKAAQRAHERELRLNAKPRKGARAESKWDTIVRRGSN